MVLRSICKVENETLDFRFFEPDAWYLDNRSVDDCFPPPANYDHD